MLTHCILCASNLIEDNCILTCINCGYEHCRILDTSIVPFGEFNEPGSQYARKYRFKTLLNELAGHTTFGEDLAKFMLQNKDKFVSPSSLNKMLVNAGLKRYTSKSAAILIWAGLLESPLTESQIQCACDKFQRLDRRIFIDSGTKCAFTFLLPIILMLVPGCEQFARSSLVKQPSQFLVRKYQKVTKKAIEKLGWKINESWDIIE